MHDRCTDSPVDQLLGLCGEPLQVFDVDAVAHQHQIDGVGVAAAGHVARDPRLGDVAELADHVLHHPVEPHVLAQDADDVVEERVLAVGAEDLAVAVAAGHQQPALLEAVEFEADGVGALAEFVGQAAEVAMYVGDQEELQQDLDAGLSTDKKIKHLGMWWGMAPPFRSQGRAGGMSSKYTRLDIRMQEKFTAKARRTRRNRKKMYYLICALCGLSGFAVKKNHRAPPMISHSFKLPQRKYLNPKHHRTHSPRKP